MSTGMTVAATVPTEAEPNSMSHAVAAYAVASIVAGSTTYAESP